MTIEIRAATLEDCPQLAAMHRQCFARGWSRDSFHGLLSGDEIFGFVAKATEADRLQGFALGRVVADEAEILTLGILPEIRRTGRASRLLVALMAEAKRRGACHLFLEVAESNHSARALYAKHGFSAVGRRRTYYAEAGEEPADALTLAVKLPAPV